MLLSAVTLVLLIACVNISNLQLARASARRKEMGMRRALGAARGRVIRQLLTESVLLASAGGVCGLALAGFGVRVLRIAAPANIPRIENLGIDTGVLCFTARVSLLVGMLFGVLPSLESSNADVNDGLKQGTGKGEPGSQKRWSQMLVVGQIAVATITRERFQTALLGVFASCALLLSIVGVYGLLSYTVSRRTSEIGVRMALGANRVTIARLTLQQGGILVLVGVAVGLLGSRLATRVLESMLYQVTTSDPSALLAVVASFVAAALVGATSTNGMADPSIGSVAHRMRLVA